MKKKRNPIVIAIIVLTIIMIVLIYLYLKPDKDITSNNDSNTIEVRASIQTIENSLLSEGQIDTALNEKIYLRSSYYFKELLVDKDIYIKERTNMLQYTNGTYLTAPYDCVLISSDLPNESEICKTNHYLELKSIESLSMDLSISETDINKVSVGDEVEITVTATKDVILGYITKISEVATYSSSGSNFGVTVSFTNNGNCKIGMSATCKIILERAENVVAIPKHALQRSDDSSYVIVVNPDGTTKNTNVETGISTDNYIEIKSGLTGREMIQMQRQSNNNSINNMTMMPVGILRGGTQFEGEGPVRYRVKD